MSNQTIASPGVQFNEVDYTLSTRAVNNNTVFMAGYAFQGPIYEPTFITSLPEYEQIYGVPTNPAERYLYHSARQILSKTKSQLLVSRLPYDVLAVEGTAYTRNILVYPLSADVVDGTGAFDLNGSAVYTIMPPVSLVIDEYNYSRYIQHGFPWDSTVNLTKYGGPADAPVGLIVTGDSQTTVNNLFEGFYIGLADNSETDPSVGFQCITGIQSMSQAATALSGIIIPDLAATYGYSTWQTVPAARLDFIISSNSVSTGTNSTISEMMLSYPRGLLFGQPDYSDSLIVSVFGLKKSIYNTSNVKLTNTLLESYMGSLNVNKTRVGTEGGAPKSVFVESEINGVSRNISVFVNPAISRQDWEDTTTDIASSKKKVILHPGTKNLYACGVYNTINSNDKRQLGDVAGKLQKAITLIDSADYYPLDITCDAGLSTINLSIVCQNPEGELTETSFNDEQKLGLSLSGNPNVSDLFGKTGGANLAKVKAAHSSILSIFETFAVTRMDHIHISDPIRHIFVEGAGSKRADRLPQADATGQSFNFYNEMYWPLFHLYGDHSTSYIAVYPDWFAVNDPTMKRNIWVPPSGVIAANIINCSPVEAPAGFSRGVLSGLADSAISPSQKQRDQLYKISMNPVAVFPGEGTVIYGQKTLLNKPSAFDRLNVRRTFIYLEKSTNSVLKYFVFEANTVLTRNRVVNTLKPTFDAVKQAGGIYDYRIVCDERNNTPNTIDANELMVDIYVKPTRTAEFILVNFYATRTDQNFSELIANG